jgi:hypothetical protein
LYFSRIMDILYILELSTAFLLFSFTVFHFAFYDLLVQSVDDCYGQKNSCSGANST